MRKKFAALLIAMLCGFAAVTSPLAQAQSSSPQDLIPGVQVRQVETNGVNLRVISMGEGPAVLLAHGWPESWYSWRHQIPALAAAGYQVIVPDMRGYGGSSAPADAGEYNIVKLAADMVGILDAYGVEKAHMVGHDWGAPVATHSVLLHPERFSSLTMMSVPYGGRSPTSPMAGMRSTFTDNFFYILYHNEAGGVAEAEYDSDPRGILSRLYLSPDSPRDAPTVTDPKRSAGGWIPRLGAAKGLPDWLNQDELDYYVSQFTQTGFRGGVNYYRNFERNWELTEHLAGAAVSVPALFIAGTLDIVIRGANKQALAQSMKQSVPQLREIVLIPEIGHWVQQEAPNETNKALLEFLESVDSGVASEQTEALPDPSSSPLFWQGNEQIAAFRNMDKLSTSRWMRAGPNRLQLPREEVDLHDLSFEHDGKNITLESYLDDQRVAGLLVLKDGNIKYERYRLGNTENSRWVSFSVAKSIVAVLYGAAIKDGYIKSVDEKVTNYLPRLKKSAYDKSSIRNLLQMASGVAWNEDYSDPESDVAKADYSTLALYEFLRNKPREARPGKKFNYNTAETNLAGTLLRSAIGNNLSTYLEEKIWQPFGMESDAFWQLTEPGGGEFGGCCINATLRDYGRLGMFALANGTLADGTQVLPKDWMAQSTAPSKGYDGYGYFWWLNPDSSYQALGVFGQGIYVNEEHNIVIAIHSARESADADEDWAMQDALYQALVKAVE